MKHQKSLRIHPLAVLALALLFMTVPALLAFAEAQVPQSSRAKAAMDRQVDAIKADMRAEGLQPGASVYLRLTKAPAELTAFVAIGDGTYRAFRTWDICTYSGGLGPKKKEGDGKSPEGFYEVAPAAMNSASSYHLSFNLGFPNAYDRAQGYTGSFLMVHGACVSIGCYAMTDAQIEEIWTLMTLAFEGGQDSIPVHIFPFPMTDTQLKLTQTTPQYAFWRELQPAWTAFEATRRVPNVEVRNGRYVIGP